MEQNIFANKATNLTKKILQTEQKMFAEENLVQSDMIIA